MVAVESCPLLDPRLDVALSDPELRGDPGDREIGLVLEGGTPRVIRGRNVFGQVNAEVNELLLAAVTEAERLGAAEADRLHLQITIHAARADWISVAARARRLLALTPADSDDVDDVRHALARAYVERQA